MPKQRSSLARGLTFARFAVRQVARSRDVAEEIAARVSAPFAIEGAETIVSAGATGWTPAGLIVRTGQRFAVSARGAIWLSRRLGLVMEPKSTLFVRIGAEIHKPADNDHVFAAWADGPVELFSKEVSEWASPAGELMAPERGATQGQIRVRVAATDAPETVQAAPAGWRYLWRLGDGTIYRPGEAGCVDIDTHGDVGILQAEVDHPITDRTHLEWSWKAIELPSQLPEDLTFTHDYLSVAVEFEDGRDLTYMWSAGLPHDHVFTCPLNYWCDRETHWVLRTRRDGLGVWRDESRRLRADTIAAYGAGPAKAVRLWLIANSIFQRGRGLASIANLRLTEA